MVRYFVFLTFFSLYALSTSSNKVTVGKNSLTNLNPDINKWYLLELEGNTFHVENVSKSNYITLNESGIKITHKNGKTSKSCDFSKFDKTKISKYSNPFYPVCDGLAYIRLNRSSETRLSLTEWATEKIRKVSFGEDFINFLKPLIVATHAEAATGRTVASSINRNKKSIGLLDALVNENTLIEPVSEKNHLGISIKNNEKFIRYGKWYESNMHDGIYVSLMIPQLIDLSIINSDDKIKKINKNEMDKLVYLTAYDLEQYSLNFVHGTQYPGLPKDSKKNLNMIGSVPPYMVDNTVSVFIGGYKRTHGKFKYGEHKGKTYGYIENGVVLSKMEPGLATIYSNNEGAVDIIKWPEDKKSEEKLLTSIVSARQNGVMIIDNYKPGKQINSWGGGNWSGDVNGNLRTLRSSVCIQRSYGKKFLLFGAFTAASPNTMAKTLQSYNCQYAMQLDMNAYMYLHNAIFKFDAKNNIDIEYLHEEMVYPKDIKRHRYIMDNNNRDFFYVFKKIR